MIWIARRLLVCTVAACQAIRVAVAVATELPTLQCKSNVLHDGHKDEIAVQTLLQATQSDPEQVKDLSVHFHEEAAVQIYPELPWTTQNYKAPHRPTPPTGRTRNHSGTQNKSSSNGSSSSSGGSGSIDEYLHRDVKSGRAAKTMVHDLHDVWKQLFPDVHSSVFHILAELCVVLAVVVWFLIYFLFVYRPDEREEKAVSGVRSMGKKGGRRSVRYGSLSPDMVLAFHHPSCDWSDGDADVKLQQIEKTFLTSCTWRRVTKILDIERVVPAGNTLWECLFVQSHHRWRKKQQSMKMPNTEQAAQEVTAYEEASDCSDPGASDALDAGVRPTGLASVRTALMKDLIEAMLASGMDLTVHLSMDQKCLLLFIALTDGPALEHYLVRDQILLRVRDEVLDALNVAQPADSITSIPIVPFDPRLLSSLHKAGILDRPVKEEFFETHASPKRSNPPSVLSSSERARIIFRELTARIDLDEAKKHGLLMDWWPVHTRRLHDFDSTWVSRKSLRGMFFKQPISAVRDYFGSQVAFMFAFKSLYSKAFLAILPVSLTFEIALNIQYLTGNDPMHAGSYAKGFSACLVIVTWSRITANLWHRERQLLLELWGLKHGNSQSLHMVRPRFRGFPGPSHIDANETVDQYPEIWYNLRMFFSTFVTFAFCGVVLVTIFIWRNQFESHMGVVASLYLSVIIKTFEFVFNFLAEQLTHFDNHRYEVDYLNSLVLRKFLFQAVTNYSAFFYIGLKHCLQPGISKRYHLLRYELVIMQLFLSLFTIAQVAWNILYVNYKVSSFKQSEQEMSFAEEQRHYTQFDTHHQVEMTSQLMISLGFIILFGSVAPIMAVFSFFVFTVQLRGYAYILTTAARRTIPREIASFDNWVRLLNGLMHIGVLMSGVFVALFSSAFRDSSIQTRVTAVLAFCIASFTIWALVDLMVPSHSREAENLEVRRWHVWSKIINTCSRVENLLELGHEELRGRFRTRVDSEEVNKNPRKALAGDWENITPVPVDSPRPQEDLA